MEKVYRLNTPIMEDDISDLKVGDKVLISGKIFCGRDAVLPKICKLLEENRLKELDIDLEGGVMFHTAVSDAGVGPTSSNKLEIESSIPMLSYAGIKVHLGKGKLNGSTVEALNQYNSIYAVIPPVTALLESKTCEKKVVAFPELGMEALHCLVVNDYPAIVAIAHGESIY